MDSCAVLVKHSSFAFQQPNKKPFVLRLGKLACGVKGIKLISAVLTDPKVTREVEKPYLNQWVMAQETSTTL